ncbi:hypothetical protein LTR28_002784, partial [Elasticomyces elasticus]
MSRSKSRRSSSRQHKAQRTLLARNLCAGRHARALCNFIQLAPSDGPPKPTPSALGFFPMRGIINEDAKRYLIQWTRNPVTGEDFWPTWKPKGWVGVPAVRKWEELKAQRIAKFYAERITRILHVSDADKGGGSIPYQTAVIGARMLPPLLSQGVSPSLRRSSTASINITPVLLAGRAVSLQQARSYSWWQSNTAWLSKLDPEFHRFSAKRAAHCRAELLKSLRRRSQLIRDTADQETSSWGWRRASTWGKPGVRWSRSEKSAAKLGEGREKQDDYDLSGRELRWREKMEDMKRRIEEDPYTAVFGKQFVPFWSPLKNRSALSEDTQSQRATGTEGTENAPETAKPKPNVSSTCWSFSSIKEPGSASPVLKATATTWNSSSNDPKHYEYDPITMRMVPIQAATEPATPIPETRVEESRSADVPVKSLKAKLSPAESSASPLKDGPTQDPVDASSKSLVGQSRQTSPLSTKAKSVKPLKPAALSKLPNDDIDLLTADG